MYVITKGVHQSLLAQIIEKKGGSAIVEIQGGKVEVPISYLRKVPEIGDKVSVSGDVEFRVVERLKANQPIVKVTCTMWVGAEDVDKL